MTPKKTATASLGVGDPDTLAKNLEDILSLLPDDGEEDSNTPVMKGSRRPRKPRLIEDIVTSTIKNVPKIQISEATPRKFFKSKSKIADENSPPGFIAPKLPSVSKTTKRQGC